MCKKSNVFYIFSYFKLIIEKIFKTPIVNIYTDGSGEYQSLKPFSKSYEIQHLLTPSHTPQHNGFS